jgi:Rad3-related DNA helicase
MTLPTLIPEELELPKKFTQWRKDQADCVDKIVHGDKKVFLLDAPTGSGKSLVGIAAYKRLTSIDKVLDRMTGLDERYRCVYLTRTIQLQEQVLDDFDGVMIKGRSNYSCDARPGDFPNFTAEDCPEKCSLPCTYLIKKAEAVHAPLAVLNDAYYLAEVNGPGQFRGANMIVVDEIDSIENCLMEFIKFSVSERQCKTYGLNPPNEMDSLVAWLNWARQAIGMVSSTLREMDRQLPMDVDTWDDIEINTNRNIKRGQSFINQMNLFISEVNDSWILDFEEKTKAGWRVTFKPVTVGPYCDKYLWRHGKRFLGMSGTILDPEIMAEDLGIDAYNYHRLDSNFPVDHRPIYYNPVANLKYANMQVELPKVTEEIARLIKLYPLQNVLVHTVSNSIRDYLITNLPWSGISPEMLMTHDTDNRASQLEVFKQGRGYVMISPSFDRGVDLPGGECSAVIIVKMPYLNLSDKQVKARLAMPTGQRWYNLKTIQTVMQMTGRAVRSETDRADAYILDKQFSSLLARTQHLLPKWWLAAIRRENV